MYNIRHKDKNVGTFILIANTLTDRTGPFITNTMIDRTMTFITNTKVDRSVILIVINANLLAKQ